MHSLPALDEEIMRTWFRLDGARRERLRLQRILTPEVFKWEKRGAPPSQSWSTLIKVEELRKLGWTEDVLSGWQRIEDEAKTKIESLAQEHIIAGAWEPIKGLGWYLCGAFIAAAGDIARASTVVSFWRGMGLDIEIHYQLASDGEGFGEDEEYGEEPPAELDLDKVAQNVIDVLKSIKGAVPVSEIMKRWPESIEDEEVMRTALRIALRRQDFERIVRVPRNTRGRQGAAQQERPRPAMPHVTLIGEQIRQQMYRGKNKRLAQFYDYFYEKAREKWPAGPKMRWHKNGQRLTQKLLYACLWRVWREGRNLPAPEAYAFDILGHKTEPIRIQHFWEDSPPPSFLQR